eukprot:TRINITY_DN3051_c0_g1_i2.p1 TRINITY_DN3051_c0_g1~~TRINITY_DN3051_c0_g1_i2.p1  ORF type:complete len:326 (+),score=100.04 TRINITY_DN3051_c0_g1_i2:177-1154(+)
MPTLEELQWCCLGTWYPKFRRDSIKTRLIPLPAAFVQLLANGTFVQPFTEPEEDVEWEDEDGDAPHYSPEDASCFAQLERQIDEAIEELGGEVVPKLNWSTPKDAVWMSPSGLKCSTPAEVFLLLKSSDRVGHDLHEALSEAMDNTPCPPTEQTQVEWVLGLRKWSNLVPSSEFRCFVHTQRLIAVCQRDSAQYYPFLLEDSPDLQTALHTFYHEKLHGQVPLGSYVFDAYVSKERKVYLLDFGPFGAPTSPAMFAWEELAAMGVNHSHETCMRVVESQGAIGLSTDMLNRLPLDFYTLSQQCSQEDKDEVSALIGQMRATQAEE